MTPIPTHAQLRAYAARRIRADSPGRIARAIGISPSALAAFVAGRSPYARTRERLLAWWFNECAQIPPVTAPGVQQALTDALDALPPEARPGVLHALTGTMRRLHAIHPEHCPPWVAELAASAEAAAAAPAKRNRAHGHS